MAAEPVLLVEKLSKSFDGRPALREVSLTLDRGHALGLVGLSGSGKSTLVRCIAGFEIPDSGRIQVDGNPYGGWPAGVQLIFQEAAASLNPRFTAEEIIAEPLLLRRDGSSASRAKAAAEWLEGVGLPATSLRKRALEFSGGERQRLSIARALAAQPKLLILDESFSGLDLMLQAQMTELLSELRRRLELTCILVTHDVGLAARIADEIAVMHDGNLVECAATRQLLNCPRHARSQELVAAARLLSLQETGA